MNPRGARGAGGLIWYEYVGFRVVSPSAPRTP